LEGAPRDPARHSRPHLPRRGPGDAVVVLLRRGRRPGDREARADREDQRAAHRQGGRAGRRHAGQRLPVVRTPAVAGRRGTVDRRGGPARAAGGVPGGDAVTVLIDDPVLDELRRILGPEHVLTGKADRLNRTRVPAPFPVHRWAERMPDLVVLPGSTEEVAQVLRLANEMRIPVVPRDGGTGLTDGAVPLRGGIVVDVKRINRIKEIDLENRT